jgi:hypothetical protein
MICGKPMIILIRKSKAEQTGFSRWRPSRAGWRASGEGQDDDARRRSTGVLTVQRVEQS